MKYVLSKEDLIRFKNMSVYMLTSDDTCKTSTEKAVDKFLKSKTPVEEIAAVGVEKNGWGQFIFTKSDETILGYTNGYPNILTEEQKDLFNNLKGKNIKIYIEVIK